jgi:aspartokinase/homoserine dehydrogenase 1
VGEGVDQRGLPIIIRNTFQPEHPGTRITAERDFSGPVKGLTLSPGLALVNVEGTGLIGVPGTAERVFAALRNAKVSVVMISQGSSEHSICCVVKQEDADRAQATLVNAFAHELTVGQVQRVQQVPGISVLAAVGDGMAGQPGVAARLFESLGRAQVNIRAIAQGSSERNISVAIDSDHATRALRAAHAGFYLSPQTFAVGVIGPGNVGAALLDQLLTARDGLLERANLDLRLRAVASRSRQLLDPRGIDGDWRGRFKAEAGPVDLDRFAAHLLDSHLPHVVIVDCSASPEVADRYPQWLAAGIHVVTPNKQAGAGPLARYAAIREASATSGARFRYEATVGAGLPVISTLRDLLDTGDAVISIEGILSGTLAWLFNKYDGSVPFSQLVAQARSLGYTEPDPRDDLSGTDVARKLVILAREAGRTLSLEDVQVESLVPEPLRQASVEDFMARLQEVDAAFASRLQAAHAAGKVLRYVARLDAEGRASVGLVELPKEHAFANLRLTDNIVQFTTRRYCENPLIVQGPGAGPEVTAAGVFADVLRVAAGRGARL